jgi:predicted type IV restriction endonuclease
MTYYEAALQILRSARRPLTAQEITDLAIAEGLIAPTGKTPVASMERVLYLRVRNDDSELIKIEEPGNARAKRSSVRWIVL